MTMSEHEYGMWCWCRPHLIDTPEVEIIKHRNLDPSTLMSRYFYGGEGLSEDCGNAAVWIDDEPEP